VGWGQPSLGRCLVRRLEGRVAFVESGLLSTVAGYVKGPAQRYQRPVITCVECPTPRLDRDTSIDAAQVERSFPWGGVVFVARAAYFTLFVPG
jgi:hypothetical protein